VQQQTETALEENKKHCLWHFVRWHFVTWHFVRTPIPRYMLLPDICYQQCWVV